MEEDAQQPTRTRKPDKRSEEIESFDGFSWDVTTSDYSILPNIWINVCATITNLAELKIVLYIMRHTWGFQEFEELRLLTTDEFVHGRKRKDGSRMDIGTGLSTSAVKEGIARALKHGYIICEVDDSDKGRIRKFYALKMASAAIQQEDPEIDELDSHNLTMPSQEVTMQEQIVASNEPDYGYRSKERTLEETYTNEYEIRNTHPSENDFENIRYLPPPSEREQRGKIPDFIKITLEDFSRDLGDHEHTASNIGQAYRLYEAHGGDPNTFMAVLDEAKAKARARTNIKKRNSQGGINRMPFFFACLRKSLQTDIAREG
jgi:hypothetical protein